MGLVSSIIVSILIAILGLLTIILGDIQLVIYLPFLNRTLIPMTFLSLLNLMYHVILTDFLYGDTERQKIHAYGKWQLNYIPNIFHGMISSFAFFYAWDSLFDYYTLFYSSFKAFGNNNLIILILSISIPWTFQSIPQALFMRDLSKAYGY